MADTLPNAASVPDVDSAPAAKRTRLGVSPEHHCITKGVDVLGNAVQSNSPRASLATLPLELLAEILLHTHSPPTVLAVSRTSSYFHRTLAHPTVSFIWRGVRKTCEPIPLPEPGDAWRGSEADYAAFVFDGGVCEVCKKRTPAMYVSFAARVRLCGSYHCRKTFITSVFILDSSNLYAVLIPSRTHTFQPSNSSASVDGHFIKRIPYRRYLTSLGPGPSINLGSLCREHPMFLWVVTLMDPLSYLLTVIAPPPYLRVMQTELISAQLPWPDNNTVLLRRSDWEQFQRDRRTYMAIQAGSNLTEATTADSTPVAAEGMNDCAAQVEEGQVKDPFLELSVKLLDWKRAYEEKHRSVKAQNESCIRCGFDLLASFPLANIIERTRAKALARQEGWELPDLLVSKTYGSLHRRKTHLLEEIGWNDLPFLRPAIESELLERQARRDRQKAEKSYKQRLVEVQKMYERMRSGTAEGVNAGGSGSSSKMVLPPLTVFCTLPSVRTLKGQPDPNTVPPENSDAMLDLKTSTLATSLITSDIHLPFLRPAIESELLERQARRDRQKAEKSYKQRLVEVQKMYERMRSGTAEGVNAGGSGSSSKMVLPPLTVFCTLPSVRTLKGQPDPNTVPPENSDAMLDLKTSTLATSLITSDIRTWLVPVQSYLMGLLGYSGVWRSASKLKVAPLERVTARFLCGRCGELGRQYRRQGCLDLRGACSHICKRVKGKGTAKKRQETQEHGGNGGNDPDDQHSKDAGEVDKSGDKKKKKKAKTLDWRVEVFQKDEKRVKGKGTAKKRQETQEHGGNGGNDPDDQHSKDAGEVDKSGDKKKKKKAKTLDWRVEVFQKDEKAIALINVVLNLLDLSDEDSRTASQLGELEGRIRCMTCTGWIVMDFETAIGHSHRHESMQIQLLSTSTPTLAIAQPDVDPPTTSTRPQLAFDPGLSERLMAPTCRARNLGDKVNYGCKHCLAIGEGNVVGGFEEAGKGTKKKGANSSARAMNLNALRSHIKGKHGIQDIRDEDMFCYTPVEWEHVEEKQKDDAWGTPEEINWVLNWC
ncbi:hypothetical protein PAXINDRAFT_15442 [Paxillus involutus ATCC 200175]|uniref:F-box domain-containing protein n=1 Tax=Paxillus involutus ATCC 200175 TaxID=664439 RepID=A0A0C9ST24_PAXIN|nr:hypothetical protein PAXINDRAFT_15442 [Paxillus involutus ATCC 200175]